MCKLARMRVLPPFLVFFATASLAAAATPDKGLAELNELTRILAPKVEVARDEIERLLDVAEVVAVRDAARMPSPMAIAYAGALELALKTPGIKPERPERVLLELSLTLARFGGTQADTLSEAFYPLLLQTLGIKREDATPRPQLDRELAEVGAWAAQTATRLLDRQPAERAELARARLALDRGRFAEAQALARKRLAGGGAPDPRWQGYLAAALVAVGKQAEAAPYLAAAQASGGEAAQVARGALVRRVRDEALDRAAKALKAQGVPIVPRASGGKARPIVDGCRQALGATEKAPSPEAVVACATVLWDDPSGALERAAKQAPAGATGAAVRAAAALRALFAEDPTKRDEAGAPARAARLETYLTDLGALKLEANARRAATLLGHVGASKNPLAWVPESAAERTLLKALDREAPCEPTAFPLKAVAVRADRPQLGAFAAHRVQTCAERPGGTAVAVDAAGLLLQLAYEDPSPVPGGAETVEPLLLKLAEKHPTDAQAIAVHADAVALRALSQAKPSAVALEAALARYEEALARSTALAPPGFRQRLEANAGYLSLAIGRLAGQADPARRSKFYQRAAQHLRFAIAFGEVPAITATRAAYDLDTGTGSPQTTLDLERLPPGRSRARAACMLEAHARARKDAKLAARYAQLARAPGPPDERQPRVPELLVDTTTTFSMLLGDRALHPIAELKTALYLAPACEVKAK